MAEEEIIIDLDEFIHTKYPSPPSPHPVNQIMGAFVLSAMKDYAANFYRRKNSNLDEYKLLLSLKKQYPHEAEEEYDHAIHKARLIYNEFRRQYSTGIIHGVPCPKKTVEISNGIFLEGKPSLLAQNTQEIFLIKTFSLHFPLKQEMSDIFYEIIGLSLLYPPPYRIWLCGFSGTGQLQSKIIEGSLKDREKFVENLKKYVEKKKVVKCQKK